MKPAALHLLWRDRAALRRFRAGASLHSHTHHSWESLRWLAGRRVLSRLVGWEHRRRTGEKFDPSRAFWRPPLDPLEALRLETRQVHGLGLPALVSLTDHDDIESGLSLQTAANPRSIAVSVEWTVPFGSTAFHLGVHNLPAAKGREIAGQLRGYSARPNGGRLRETLEALNQLPDTLIVLNHPLWDEAGVGLLEHTSALRLLLECCAPWIHALEVNGLRSWAENSQVLELAEAWELPAVAGGDRHGLEPNAAINLTSAQTVSEFAAEVRHGRISHILFLPQYREPLRLRMLEAVGDVFRSGHWTDRFFYEGTDGVRRPLSEVWRNERPALAGPLLAFLRASDSERLRPALRKVLADRAEALPA
jgi:hypothetical protein